MKSFSPFNKMASERLYYRTPNFVIFNEYERRISAKWRNWWSWKVEMKFRNESNSIMDELKFLEGNL